MDAESPVQKRHEGKLLALLSLVLLLLQISGTDVKIIYVHRDAKVYSSISLVIMKNSFHIDLILQLCNVFKFFFPYGHFETILVKNVICRYSLCV